MSITASIAALAVMLIRIPLRKAPKIFSYALWGVVLFRLIFPFSIESIFSLMPTSANVIPQDIVDSQTPMIQTGVQFIDLQINTGINNALPIVTIENSVNSINVIFEIAGFIWFVGFIGLLIYAVLSYISLKRRVRFATLVRDNVFETDKIKTPFVLGFIRPVIYFPTTINLAQHDYILKHEQVHIKRRDYLIKPFAYIVFTLHWFNPIMWVAYFLMSKDMEMSCDEAVLRNTSEDIRSEYSTSLLNLATERVRLLSPIAFAFGESNVKERVENVLSFKKHSKWVTVVSVIAVVVFLVGFSSDRVLAVDAHLSLKDVYAPNPLVHRVINYSVNHQGWAIANANEAERIALSILNRYFSAFRQDWSNWENPEFSASLIENAQWPDGEGGYQVISAWMGRASDYVVDHHRFFIPPLLFYFNDETGKLINAMYSPPIEFIATSLRPFEISFEEALEINRFYMFPLEFMNGEYRDMLIEFSLEHLALAGISGGDDLFVDIDHIYWFSTEELLLFVGVEARLASGYEAMLNFWVSEEGFAFVDFRLDFAQ